MNEFRREGVGKARRKEWERKPERVEGKKGKLIELMIGKAIREI